MSLYQKYRPKKFADVLSQKVIIKTLVNAIKHDKINHAYVFAGPKGIGKTTIAKIFAKAVNCKDFSEDVCNRCECCSAINNENVTDIVELDAASNNGVEDIRNLLESTRFLPTTLKYKVYIIDEAHMLSNSAWNSLLKTLEEPPSYVIFIFATTEIHKLPGTIISRCQCFEFLRLGNNEIANLINKVVTEQKIKITKQAINLIANLASGSARDSLSILEQVALYSDNNIEVDHINEIFGLLVNETKLEIIKYLQNKKVAELISLLNDLETKGINFNQLTLDLANLLLDQLIYTQTKDLSLVKYLTKKELETLDINQNVLINLINQCQSGYNQIKNSQDPRFDFEVLMFSLMQLFANKTLNVEKVKEAVKSAESIKKETKEVAIEKIIQKELVPPVFNTKDFVVLKERKLEVNKEEVVKKATKTETLKPETNVEKQKVDKPTTNNIDKIIYQIINSALKIKDINTVKSLLKSAEENLQKIKDKAEAIYEFSWFKNVASVKVASQNGLILIFNDKIDAQFLNKHIFNAALIRNITNIFQKPMYVIGLTNKQFSDYVKNINEHQSNELTTEPNIQELENVLEQADYIGHIADFTFRNKDK